MTKPNEAVVHRISSWGDYVKIINSLPLKSFGEGSYQAIDRPIFRGQSNANWKLQSKLERSLDYTWNGGTRDGKSMMGVVENLKLLNGSEWYEQTCDDILSRFRNNVIQIPGAPEIKDDVELWALGRHHGLLTPLLDWSFSPYVSTFFAFYDLYKLNEVSANPKTPPAGGTVSVWKLGLWKEVFLDGEFEAIEIKSKIGERLNAQNGLFTILKTHKFSDVETYLKSRNLASHLERFELPYEIAEEALMSMESMGLNIFRLFPDFIGAAEQANIDDFNFRIMHTFRKAQEDEEKAK